MKRTTIWTMGCEHTRKHRGDGGLYAEVTTTQTQRCSDQTTGKRKPLWVSKTKHVKHSFHKYSMNRALKDSQKTVKRGRERERERERGRLNVYSKVHAESLAGESVCLSHQSTVLLWWCGPVD